MLNLDEPTYTPFLQNIKFSKDTLNSSQKEAIRKALYSDSISLIQGPPGTGKTTVIKEIVRQILMQINKFDDTSRILVVSQSHTAVDNIIEGLVDIDEGKLDIIRIGRAENISPKVEETCTMNAIRKKMFTEIKEKSNTYIEQQNLLYANITEQKSLDRWERIKDIQADWINRCSNLETLDYQVIKSATIIAGTCVGFLSNDFVKELDFDYVIIDEAAKATTPELLVSIIKSKKIILVGDQNQLPAYADQELSPIIAKLTKEPKYRLFDLLFNVLPDTHKQKDVIYCTTNRCSLLAKGKQALRELRTVQRKKDRVKNVYLDPINRKIILEHENYQFVDRVNVNDKKLDADFEVNDIEIFKENIDSVNKVFLDEMNIYNDKTKSEPDELLSIDSIENVYVKFVRIPIYIYVSSEGIDIDIMAVNKRNDPLLVLFKSEIIEQIRKKKVLKNIFVKYGLRKTFLGVDLEENENLKNDLQKYRKNKGDRDELEPIIEKEILSDRKLSDEEFEVLLKYLADKCENCKINVYHLDDWAKSEWCSKVLSVLNGKKLSEIGYAECYDFRKALSIIQRTMPECSRDKVVQVKTEYYLSLVFDEKYIITGVPKDIVIMDSNTHIHKVEFYLQVM